MCRFSPSTLPILVAASSSLCLLFARSASAALPPGYEDVMHCPPGYCRQYVNPKGLLGATSLFNKCYDPATGDMVDGVWTGSLTDVVAPEGWVANPEDCPEPTPVAAPGSDVDENGCIPSAGYSWCAGLSECIRPWETDCPDDQPIRGGDVDEYGCIPSAGYSWCAGLSECVRPWETDCPDEVETAPVGGNEAETGLDQYADIITDCGIQIGAAVACFTTSQEPACEGFDPMSLIGGDLPIPDDCEGGVELVCAALVGCCDQEIVDIAACAAQSQGLDCDIDCGGDAPPDPTSAGSTSAAAATLVLAALVGSAVLPF